MECVAGVRGPCVEVAGGRAARELRQGAMVSTSGSQMRERLGGRKK